jgi:hypothetical protein
LAKPWLASVMVLAAMLAPEKAFGATSAGASACSRRVLASITCTR